MAGSCQIGGVSYASGTPNPSSPCRSCQPSVDSAAWTKEPAGTTCSDGNAWSYDDTCNGSGVCEHLRHVDVSAVASNVSTTTTGDFLD